MNQFKYYCLFKGEEEFVPRLQTEDWHLYLDEPVGKEAILNLTIGKPIPKTPNLHVDYLTSPLAIVSDRVASVINCETVYGVELISAIIHFSGSEHSGFKGLHIYNLMKCVDLEASDLVMDSGGILSMKELVLDQGVLEKIPLVERLAFRLAEDHMYELYHESLVELIKALNPVNMYFVPIEDLNKRSWSV